MAWDEEEYDDPAGDVAAESYNAVRHDRGWLQTRHITVKGPYFGHQKHPADVKPGLQHTLRAWHCEARPPAPYCGCGLYTIQWEEGEADGGG